MVHKLSKLDLVIGFDLKVKTIKNHRYLQKIGQFRQLHPNVLPFLPGF